MPNIDRLVGSTGKGVKKVNRSEVGSHGVTAKFDGKMRQDVPVGRAGKGCAFDLDDLIKGVPLVQRSVVRDLLVDFLRGSAAQYVTSLVQGIEKMSALQPIPAAPIPCAYNVSKLRDGFMIRCPGGATVYLASSPGTNVLMMTLANAGLVIEYAFLTQAEKSGPWTLIGNGAESAWRRQSRGCDGEVDPDVEGHVAYEDELHLAGGVPLEATDRETLDDCRALLSQIEVDREEAMDMKDVRLVAELDEKAKGVRKYMRDVTDKCGNIRKKGMNPGLQRRLHANFERAIQRVREQDATLGDYLDRTVDRGAKFRFSGDKSDFVFETGALASVHQASRTGDRDGEDTKAA